MLKLHGGPPVAPWGAESLVCLLRLSLCDLDWRDIPARLLRLPAVLSLHVSRCHELIMLTPNIKKLATLLHIFIANCNSLAYLPRELGELTYLVSLKLFHCTVLTSLPRELGRLLHLRSIYTYNCYRLSIAEEAVRAPALQDLYVVGGPLKAANVAATSPVARREGANVMISPDMPLQLPECVAGWWVTVLGSEEMDGVYVPPGCNVPPFHSHATGRGFPEPGEDFNLCFFGCHNFCPPVLDAHRHNIRAVLLVGCPNVEFVEWLRGLPNLVTLYLVGCNRLKRLPPGLYKIENLRVVVLMGCRSLEGIEDGMLADPHFQPLPYDMGWGEHDGVPDHGSPLMRFFWTGTFLWDCFVHRVPGVQLPGQVS